MRSGADFLSGLFAFTAIYSRSIHNAITSNLHSVIAIKHLVYSVVGTQGHTNNGVQIIEA